MSIQSISQPIGEIIRLRTGNITDWYIDRVKWTGPILTVGVGKDYTNMTNAINAANATGVGCLILVDAGSYAAWTNSPTYQVYIRGLGATADDTVIYGGGGLYVFLENIYIYGTVDYWHDGALYTAHGTANKCRIGSGPYPGQGTIWPLYYQGVLEPYLTLYLYYTRLDRTPEGPSAAHINSAALGCISLSKVSYTSSWIVRNSTGTLLLDDKAADGTSGYGPSYGDYRIKQPLLQISQPIGDTIRLRKPGIGAIASYSQPIGNIINLRRNV